MLPIFLWHRPKDMVHAELALVDRRLPTVAAVSDGFRRIACYSYNANCTNNHLGAIPVSAELGKSVGTDIVMAFQQFISDEVAGGMAADDTARTYSREARAYWEWCQGRGIDPLQATRDDVVAYRRDLLDRYAPASVSLELSAVRRFYAAAKAKGAVTDNPAADVRGPKQKRRGVEYLSEGQLDRVFRVVPRDTEAGRRDVAILGLMGLQGLRLIEIVRLDFGDLRVVDDAPRLRVMGKGGGEDLLPILPVLAERVQEYLGCREDGGDAQAPMFVSTRTTGRTSKGARLSRRAVQVVCAKYFTAAGVKARAHTLRHTAATLALKGGADLLQVQAMLRHSDSKTTARYTHALNGVEHNPAQFIGVECG